MAAAQLKLSRRALLGAPFIPLILSGAEPSRSTVSKDAPLHRNWDRALARFRSAEARVAALEGDPDEDSFDRALIRFNALLRRLIALPSPDLAALATKLEIAVAAELADMTYAPPALADLARDARALSLS